MKLASIFTDHMVVQKGLPIRIFGTGCGKAEVTFLGNTASEIFENDSWCLTLPEAQYGGPYEMKIRLNDEEITLTDIYVGEVWIASGQSNMEMPLFRTRYGFQEAKYAHNEKIRFFDVPRRVERDVQKYGWPFFKTDGKDTPWEVCCEDTVLRASAIGYYVAKYKEELKSMYAFIKQRYDEANYDEIEYTREHGLDFTRPCPYKGYPACYKKGPNHPDCIGVLYDSMVSRITPFGVCGVLWYQGEANVGEGYAENYGVYMDCMKDSFINPNMKFYSVEITGQMACGDDIPTGEFVVEKKNKAFTREAQRKAAMMYPDNHIVTTMQLADANDIHALNKESVAHRMVLKILRYSYGFDIKCEEPTFESASFRDGKAYIKLNNADGLMSPELVLVNMYIADKSKKCKRADIEIDGDTLILSNPEVKEPVYARYAFGTYYIGGHIVNDISLPLAPFRTDNE